MPNVVDFLSDLSYRQSVLDFTLLTKTREKEGFVCFVKDFLKEPTTEGDGWSLNKPFNNKPQPGILRVSLTHNTNELQNFIESKLDIYGADGKPVFPWYENKAVLQHKLNNSEYIPEPQLPPDFTAYPYNFKPLGRWGENPAMDVAIILEDEDGSLYLQHIIRFDNTFAFIGGMLDSALLPPGVNPFDVVIEKCLQESLEEMYSAKLFAAGSPTLREAGRLYNNKHEQLVEVLKQVFANEEFNVLEPIKAKLLNVFAQSNLDVANKIKFLEKTLKEQGATIMDRTGAKRAVRDEELDVKWVRIKYRLYQYMFPAQYNDFDSFLKSNLVALNKTTNESDPRNTQASFMTTTPHYMLLKRAELAAKEAQWLLQPRGGDDALSAKITRLEDLFDLTKTNNKPMYSAHSRIFLDILAEIARKDLQYFEHPIRANQLEKVLGFIKARELSELNLVREARSGAVLQFNQNGNTPALPILSNEAAVQQYNRVLEAGGIQENVSLSLSVQQSQEEFRSRLGDVGYARLEGIIEHRGLPASAWIELAKLLVQGKVNILLDDSGSMDLSYINDQHPNDPQESRWAEAHRRILDIMELLSLAGVKVEIRLINRAGVQTFDFSVKNGDTIATLEQKFFNAKQKLASDIFNRRPSGGTNITVKLNEIFGATPMGKQALLLFISDGEVNEQAATLAILQNPQRRPADNPMIVVACCRSKINWPRGLKQEFCVAQMDDFSAEQMIFQARHGNLIRYTKPIFDILQITAPAASAEASSGLQLYHVKGDEAYTHQQVAELLGYPDLPQALYNAYLRDRNDVIQGNNVVMGQPVVGYFPSVGNNTANTAPNLAPGGQQQSNQNTFGYRY